MPGISWSAVKHAATGHWSRGNVFFRVMNHTSLSGDLWTNLVLVDTRRTLYTVKSGGRGTMGLFGLGPFTSSEGSSQCDKIKRHFSSSMGKVLGCCDCAPVHINP